MPLTSVAARRLNKDILDLQKNKDVMSEMGIFVEFDDDNMTNMYALLIGDEGTPYEGGFYFFNITIPDKYPVQPPKVKFLSTASNVRIHPNLYTEGKVCLSIINTWEGDGWAPSYKIRTMLMAIKTYVFVPFPLHNEPGYEKESEEEGSTIEIYTRFVCYQNFRTCINNMIESLPKPLTPFRSIMDDHIRTHANTYFKRLLKYTEERQGKEVYSTAYSSCSQCVTDYELQLDRFTKYCATIGVTPETSAEAVVSSSKGSKTAKVSQTEAPVSKMATLKVVEKVKAKTNGKKTKAKAKKSD